jgi:hypothetical protein
VQLNLDKEASTCLEKGLKCGQMIGFSTVIQLQQFIAKKLVTEMEHSICSPDLAPNNFWLFPNIKFALKGRRFQDTEDI